jgi:hypothetical protein
VNSEENFADERSARLQSALAVEELVAANNESNQTMMALVEHVRQETVANDRKIEELRRNTKQFRNLMYALVVTMAFLLVIAGVNAYNLAESKKEQEQIEAINRTLLDCQNSTGECGRANAQNQKRLLDEVKEYELTGFYCIRTNPAQRDPDGDAFLKCMDRLYPNGPTLNGR